MNKIIKTVPLSFVSCFIATATDCYSFKTIE